MYTFCPSCQTIFRLTTRHLARAGGCARCGECHQVYSAVDYLFEDLSTTREARPQGRRSTAEQAVPAAPGLKPDGQAAHDMDADASEQMPQSSGNSRRSSSTLPWVFSGTLIIVLGLCFAGQWIFFNRAELAVQPGWRPGLEQFCKYLKCSLPMLVDLSQLELLNRDVRQHPRVKEALLVNVSLSNKADFVQPYPVLEVSFSDLAGKPVALRRFRPREYVHDEYAIKRGMQPGEPVQIVLEIKDPGKSAVSYQFGFL